MKIPELQFILMELRYCQRMNIPVKRLVLEDVCLLIEELILDNCRSSVDLPHSTVQEYNPSDDL